VEHRRASDIFGRIRNLNLNLYNLYFVQCSQEDTVQAKMKMLTGTVQQEAVYPSERDFVSAIKITSYRSLATVTREPNAQQDRQEDLGFVFLPRPCVKFRE